MANTVTVYPRGDTSPKYTISNGLSWPYGIALDSKRDLFVSNIYSDTVTAYHKGQTSPYEIIPFGNYGQVMGVGIDANDNVWAVSDYGPPYPTVNVYKYGVTSPYRTITDGIEHYGATLNAVTASDEYFQANQRENIVGYKKGQGMPFSTLNLTLPAEPLGIAAWPLVRK